MDDESIVYQQLNITTCQFTSQPRPTILGERYYIRSPYVVANPSVRPSVHPVRLTPGPLQTTLSKLLTYCVLRPTQPPTLSGTKMSSS